MLQHMLNGLDTGLTGSKIYTAKQNDWKDFLARILIATIINEPTPTSFFDYYNFDRQVLLLKERIQKIKEGPHQMVKKPLN